VEVNYLFKMLCPLHLLCILASSRCLCVLIAMLQDNSKRKLYIMPGYCELDPSMCSSLQFAYRFLHCLVGIFDLYAIGRHMKLSCTRALEATGRRVIHSQHCTRMPRQECNFLLEWSTRVFRTCLLLSIPPCPWC
jgi:hypothetical protein